MIISHQYKFIFLRTTKTAGTSLAIALSKYCGDRDVITGTGNDEDRTIRTEIGSRDPQNCYLPLWRHGVGGLYELLAKQKRKVRFHEHMTAANARKEVGDRIWNSYFKFCFVRNPWDRVISYYHFICPNDPRPTLSEFIATQAHIDNLNQRGLGIYTIDGKVALDRVYQYEKLTEAIEDINQSLGLPEKIEMPNAKRQYRKDSRGYRDILKWHEVDRISKAFAEEIELFDYIY